MDWGVLDFVTIGTLLIVTGFGLVWVRRNVKKSTHRIALVVAILLAALWLYVEMAVGLFTNWGS